VNNGSKCLELVVRMDVAYCHLLVSDVDQTLYYVMQNFLPRVVCVRVRICMYKKVKVTLLLATKGLEGEQSYSSTHSQPRR
jgi:hypothetical protein